MQLPPVKLHASHLSSTDNLMGRSSSDGVVTEWSAAGARNHSTVPLESSVNRNKDMALS